MPPQTTTNNTVNQTGTNTYCATGGVRSKPY